ncbi:ribonuclease P protein component [Candidatus Uhrbacteria bacterium]|nr:ribonuclease P protein component [Candidatus Uhrbacteria bacterium]
MVPKENRLRKREDFDRIWKQGRSRHGKLLGLRFAPNQDKVGRCGIMVGLKVSKRATRRNHLRRRIREALRREFLPILGAFDVIIMAHPQSAGASYVDIKKELAFLFGKAGLFKKSS